MDILPFVYLGYMFVSLYMLILFLLIYLRHSNELFTYPKITKKYSVSFIVPAFNEEDSIEETIKHISKIDYVIEEIIAVNDKSNDDTGKILDRLKKDHQKLKVIHHSVNGGKAQSLNDGIKIAKGELIAVVDADSFPREDSLKRTIGFFDDEKVGAVTIPVFPRNRNKFFEKLQVFEYKVISFSRKLLDYVGGIYVTPGPFALYRKSALLNIGGFDPNNMTEDIEATWHLASQGYSRRMSLGTHVTSVIPNKFRDWYKQRRRWNVGGLQCINKYKQFLFTKGMFGWFIIPLFIISTFLGLLGLSIFFYLWSTRIISNYLYTKYSIIANTPLITLDQFYITPSILNYLGGLMFFFGLVLTLVMMYIMKERIMKKENVFNVPFFMVVYLAAYPFIMLDAIRHAIRRRWVWR